MSEAGSVAELTELVTAFSKYDFIKIDECLLIVNSCIHFAMYVGRLIWKR